MIYIFKEGKEDRILNILFKYVLFKQTLDQYESVWLQEKNIVLVQSLFFKQ